MLRIVEIDEDRCPPLRLRLRHKSFVMIRFLVAWKRMKFDVQNIPLSLSSSIFYLSGSLSVRPSVCLYARSSVYLLVCPSVFLSVFLPIRLAVCVLVCMSGYSPPMN